jgi:2-keto-4-pentenoate hydratase/2-oxohepta-3-ene-1,7-dioic acid hydratase in catechol pathway
VEARPVSSSPERIARFARIARASGAAYAACRDGSYLVLDAPPWAGGRETGERVPGAEGALLCPSLPGKIVCVGLNYLQHVAESSSRSTVPDEPVLFLKPPSALLPTGGTIVVPAGVGRVDHETEMALVVGRRIRRASVEEARDAIFGVTALNDVSARELQKRDVQWTRAKGFDTFCPLGPVIACGLDPDDLALWAAVNGVRRQDGHTRDLIVKSAALVAFISRSMTLEPGDVVSTGTPAGVGPIVPGDLVEVGVEGVGALVNPVGAEPPGRSV